MLKKCVSPILLIVLVSFYLYVNNAESISTEEYQSLRDLYMSTLGERWVLPPGGLPWDFDSNPIDPCNWTGVSCKCSSQLVLPAMSRRLDVAYSYFYDDGVTQYCQIEKLKLMNHNLNGTVPFSVGNLRYLTHLHLGKNSLFGTLPSTIGHLSKLKIFSCSSNNFRGRSVLYSRY